MNQNGDCKRPTSVFDLTNALLDEWAQKKEKIHRHVKKNLVGKTLADKWKPLKLQMVSNKQKFQHLLHCQHF